MRVAVRGLVDLQRAVIHRLRLIEPAKHSINDSDVAERGCDVGVIGAERLLARLDDALVRLARILELAAVAQHGRVLVERRHRARVIGAELLAGERERLLVARLRLIDAVLRRVEQRDRVL
ncbi:MAG: hypothetical protein JO257_17800 [Deltaproteobacteria bacterium]|nr:hypothetical protein [Deltaproteobacteria bacterium]